MELTPSFSGSIQRSGGGGLFAVFGGMATLLIFALGGFAVFFMGTGFFGVIQLPEWLVPVSFFVLFCGGFAGVTALGAAVRAIRTRARRAKLADAIVRIDGPLRPGQSFDVVYEQTVNSAVDITSMTAKLILREWVRYTSGTDTHTKTHDVVVDERVLPSRSYGGSSVIQESIRFQLPPGAIHTWDNKPWVAEELFTEKQLDENLREWEQNKEKLPDWMQNMVDSGLNAANNLGTGIGDNKITWHVLFEIAIPRTPDYNQAWELPVQPKIMTDEDTGGWF